MTGALLIVGGIVIALAGWLGRIGRLPRNGFVGIRVPSTMRTDETWKVAHVASAGTTMAAGAALAIGGAAEITSGPSDAVVMIAVGVALALVLGSAFVGIKAAKQIS